MRNYTHFRDRLPLFIKNIIKIIFRNFNKMSIKSRRINLLKFIDKFSEIIWFKKKNIDSISKI